MLDDSVEVSIAASSDVVLSAPQSNQTLKYNSGTAKWVNSAVAIANVTNLQTTLDAKADATTTAIVVQWTGSAWPTYSTSTSRVRHFYSQDDVNASAPTGYNVHDLWFAHPEAS